MSRKIGRLCAGHTLFDDIKEPINRAYNRLAVLRVITEDGLDFYEYYSSLTDSDRFMVDLIANKVEECGWEQAKRNLLRNGML